MQVRQSRCLCQNQPNQGVQATPSSVRSAPAFGRA